MVCTIPTTHMLHICRINLHKVKYVGRLCGHLPTYNAYRADNTTPPSPFVSIKVFVHQWQEEDHKLRQERQERLEFITI